MERIAWCACGNKGTCLGCMIQNKVYVNFGAMGKKWFNQFLQQAHNDAEENRKLREALDKAHILLDTYENLI